MEILQRTKKSISTKVDLTPMVDLGFLLITFFMLATTFSKPKTMEVIKPDTGDEIPIPESKTATLILGTRNIVFTYSLPEVMPSPLGFSIDSIDYGSEGVRKFIQRRQSEVESRFGDKDLLFVIIKPLPGSSLKNIVDVLDEMVINNVKRYAIVDLKAPIDSMVVSSIGEKW